MHLEASIHAELLRLERALLSNEIRKSFHLAGELLTEDFQEFGSSGRIYTRQQILNHLSTEPPVDLTLEDFKASHLSEAVVLVSYRSTRRTEEASMTANRSSIWIFAEGRWRIRFHQGTPTTADPST